MNLLSPLASPRPHPPQAVQAAEQPVWVLLGSKQGDNAQILALAQSLGLPFRRIQLRFNALHWLLPAMLGPSLWSLRNRSELQGAAPRLVISSGLRSVPAARWLQRQSQQDDRRPRCRLVHIGRPWGPFRWFDLVITTPQYALPTQPNVHHNLLPLMAAQQLAAPLSPALAETLAGLPRPWTVVLLGGHSRPLRFTPEAAQALAAQLDRAAQARGGSVLVLGSPRTPRECIEAMRPLLTMPHHIWPFGEGANPYAALRGAADRFVVTADSVQMATELLLCGKPLEVFPLPEVADVLVRLTRAWRDAAQRRSWLKSSFEWARNHGLLSSLRDIGLFHRQLETAGVYAHPDLARALVSAERKVTVHHVRQLLREFDELPAAATEPAAAPAELGRQPLLHRR